VPGKPSAHGASFVPSAVCQSLIRDFVVHSSGLLVSEGLVLVLTMVTAQVQETVKRIR
jgi:hypothetical protein